VTVGADFPRLNSRGPIEANDPGPRQDRENRLSAAEQSRPH